MSMVSNPSYDAAVNRNAAPRHVARTLRGEKRDHVRDFLRFSETAERNISHAGLADLFEAGSGYLGLPLPVACLSRSIDGSGSDGVDENAVARILQRHRFGPVDDCRVVDADSYGRVAGFPSRGAGDVHDPAPAAFLHFRHNLASDTQKAQQFTLDAVVPLLVADLAELDCRHAPGVVDENMNRTEPFSCRTNQSLDIFELADIALHRECFRAGLLFDFVARLREPGFAAGADNHSRPFARQRVRCCVANPIARTGYYCHFTSQPEIHSSAPQLSVRFASNCQISYDESVHHLFSTSVVHFEKLKLDPSL